MNHLIFEASTETFQAHVLDSTVPVLIEFTADWCPPCKMIEPILNQIAIQYEGQLRVGMIDADDNTTIVQQYTVMGLPTLLLFIDGSPVERIVGFTSQARIESQLLPYLNQQKA